MPQLMPLYWVLSFLMMLWILLLMMDMLYSMTVDVMVSSSENKESMNKWWW